MATKINVTIDGQSFAAELNDSAAAKELLSHLPLQLKLASVPGYAEKVAELPAAYDTTGMDYAEDLKAGDLAYWKPKEAPNQRLVLYAGDAGHWDGIFVVGHFTTGGYEDLLNSDRSDLTAKISRV